MLVVVCTCVFVSEWVRECVWLCLCVNECEHLRKRHLRWCALFSVDFTMYHTQRDAPSIHFTHLHRSKTKDRSTVLFYFCVFHATKENPFSYVQPNSYSCSRQCSIDYFIVLLRYISYTCKVFVITHLFILDTICR